MRVFAPPVLFRHPEGGPNAVTLPVHGTFAVAGEGVVR